MTPRYKVILMPEALSDLERIGDFIAETSVQNAVNQLRRICKSIEPLELFPQQYRVYQSKRRKSEIRVMSQRPWLIYYRIIEETKTVRVLTIRHGAQRQPKRFD